MANSLIFGSKVVFANGNALTLATSASDPGSAAAGDIYFNSVSNVIRFYDGSAWLDIDHELLGLSLNENEVVVGNSSNLSAAVDSSASGDILVDASTGLTIKSAVIVNGQISASAAIAYSKLNLSDSIVNADINSAAAIALSKLAALTASKALVSDSSGVVSASSVTATELGYVSGVTSAIQTQLDATEKTANKGQNNGYASLDSGGKVPLAQLPASLMEYQGTWDASTNTPSLADGVGGLGQFYRVQVAGTQNLGSGNLTFVVSDWVMYNGSIWELAHAGADAVISVNGSAGAVTVNAINQLTGDITAGPASGSESKAATIAAGAVSASKLGSVTDGVTLDQSGAGSTLEVKAGGISNSHINAAAAIAYSKLNLAASVKASDINSEAASAGKVLTADGAGAASWETVASGSVTSVALSDASASPIYSVSGSPVTSSGTLTITLANQSANQVFAGPSTGSPAEPAFRSLVADDVPDLSAVYESVSNFAVRSYSNSLSLAANTSSLTAISGLSFAKATYGGAIIDYVIREAVSLKQRTGRLFIATDGTVVSSSDQYSETAQLGAAAGLLLQAVVNGANIEVQFNNTDASNGCTMRAEVTKFLAQQLNNYTIGTVLYG